MKPSASDAPGKDFLKFVNGSPTPFHAVHNLKLRLKKAGYEEIKERDDWGAVCKPGGKYVLTRNGSSIITFAIGAKWKPGNPVAMVGTHTDSPCMRLKPNSKAQAHGYLQCGVEMYGGGLWHTWFDRDLSLAGRVMAKTADGGIHQKLVRINRPILRIPTLAVHFDRQETFSFSKESQLFPIAGLVEAELNRQGKTAADNNDEAKDEAEFASIALPKDRHHAYIVELLAKEAEVEPEAVLDFECVLYDTQASCLGGLNSELVFSPRIDNLMMTYCAVQGLLDSTESASALKNEHCIRLVAAFDNEEIGSLTQQGANSSLLPDVLHRLTVLSEKNASSHPAAYEQTLAKSFLISADMAHAVHPNYAAKHEARHHPLVNGGPVVKINVNGRYTSNSPGVVLLREAAQKAEVPLQLFVINQDSLCGGTIGPMLASKLGARAVDIGNPQLSMHSIRETGGVYDVDYALRLTVSFFENYGELEKKIIVD